MTRRMSTARPTAKSTMFSVSKNTRYSSIPPYDSNLSVVWGWVQKLHLQKAGDHMRQHAEAGRGFEALYDHNEKRTPQRVLCWIAILMLPLGWYDSGRMICLQRRFSCPWMSIRSPLCWENVAHDLLPRNYPEIITFGDVAQAVFTGNPDCLNVEETEGIWTS